jgi:hypothetical protein
MFFDLAQSWLRLAAELEDANAFLNALNEIEFEDGPEDSLFEGGQHEATQGPARSSLKHP